MSTLTITFIEPSGNVKAVSNVKPGQSLMSVARDNGIEGILAECGGSCSCATCHVVVDDAWQAVVGPAKELESDMLEIAEQRPEGLGRLSCQVEVTEKMDGLQVTVVSLF